MTQGFPVGIEFDSVLAAISKQIYETPLAFLRENVQNAVDALRIQAAREGQLAGDERYAVEIAIEGRLCTIRDNGIGMSLDDLRNLFWTIGASGKRTQEARDAGCVGMFGIGGFANFGVCDDLTVTSQPEASRGHWTRLSREDIEGGKGGIPEVGVGDSDAAAPRGTIVAGLLKSDPSVPELEAYVRDFVQYSQERVFFNGVLMSGRQRPSAATGDAVPLHPDPVLWEHNGYAIVGQMYETAGHVLLAELTGLTVNGESVRLAANLRFENGPIDVLKRGFKICATGLATQIGVSGTIDCDQLSPTAGRDSLDAESSALVAGVVGTMERAAVLAVLAAPERISQHTRVFRYIRTNGLVPHLGNVIVDLVDGSETKLDDLRIRSEGGVRVFFATSQNKTLSQLLQTRGHAVVQLPADRDKQIAVRQYLTDYCKAEAFEGRIECAAVYTELTRFERAFLSELEHTIVTSYDVAGVKIVPGQLTEDVPVFAPESQSPDLTVFVDVRHSEVAKLESLGINSLLFSMVAVFCREYLGATLKSRSPKFFGSGAVNMDFLSKRRSEMWVLLSNDIEVLTRTTSTREVVRTSDVHVVHAGAVVEQSEAVTADAREPKLIRIEGSDEFAELFGYYLRIPNSAFIAYGDVIQQCDARGVIWAGNKILFVVSDAISSAFQLEVRLDRIIAPPEGAGFAGGAVDMDRPAQGLFGGLYLPLPVELEDFLVPSGADEIRIELRCDWIDFSSARKWEAHEPG